MMMCVRKTVISKTTMLLCAALVVVLTGSAAGADVTAGLVGHWPLNGDTLDVSGQGRDGTLVGDAHLIDDGVFGGALELDGDGDYVEMTGYKGPLQSPWTLSCWVKTTGTGDMDILSWGTEGGGLKVEFRFNAGLLRIEHGNGNIRGDAPANDGEWHHAVAQLPQGVTIKGVLFFLDGKPLGIFAIGNGDNPFNITEGADFNIGRSGPRADRYFTGAIDDVRIYDRLLTPEEIKQIGAQPKARKPNPANGAVGVNLPLLQWTPGDTATLHTVYLGTSPDLTEADQVAARQPLAAYYHAPGLQPGTTYYWRVDETEADMSTLHTGDVWSFIAQALTAYGPSPADGANSAAPSPTLNWLPGQAALEHHVYFGAARDAVAQGDKTTDKGLLKETTFAPGALDEATTYYWRVDEVVAGGTVRTGPVWSFTTILLVDDFESYNDDLDAKTTIFDTWIDGLTDGLSNSIVGHAQAPFAEQTIVHGGKQSMPLDYNNIKSPFYSEAEQTFATAQDWTVNGVDTLVLYVRGRSANGAAPMHVTLKDASNRSATVSHPDPAVLTRGRWTEWKIPLSDFAGVSLSRVKTIVLGVGDKNTSTPGSAGLIYVDDIHLRRP
jgi:hypothetical protein